MIMTLFISIVTCNESCCYRLEDYNYEVESVVVDLLYSGQVLFEILHQSFYC